MKIINILEDYNQDLEKMEKVLGCLHGDLHHVLFCSTHGKIEESISDMIDEVDRIQRKVKYLITSIIIDAEEEKILTM